MKERPPAHDVHEWPLFFYKAIYFYMTLGLYKPLDFYIPVGFGILLKKTVSRAIE